MNSLAISGPLDLLAQYYPDLTVDLIVIIVNILAPIVQWIGCAALVYLFCRVLALSIYRLYRVFNGEKPADVERSSVPRVSAQPTPAISNPVQTSQARMRAAALPMSRLRLGD